MNYNIEEIEGVGPAHRQRLAVAKIRTTVHLLERCNTPAGRKQTSAQTGLPETQLLKWVNMADLMQISGVGKQNAHLLEAAGVNTIEELCSRDAEQLFAQLEETNASRNLAKTTPAVKVVQAWIDQAKSMPAKISY